MANARDVLLISLTFGVVANALPVVNLGGCPDPTPDPTFKSENLLGQWYSHFEYSDLPFAVCPSYNVSLSLTEGPGVLLVNSTPTSIPFLQLTTSHKYFIEDPLIPGFMVMEPIGPLANEVVTPPHATVTIVKYSNTNSENDFVAQMCCFDMNFGHITSLYLLSKTPVATNETLQQMETFVLQSFPELIPQKKSCEPEEKIFDIGPFIKKMTEIGLPFIISMLDSI